MCVLTKKKLKHSVLHVFIPPPQELHVDIQSQFLPEMLSTMLQTLHSHMDTVSLEDFTQSLRACFKVLSKIQMPVAYMDIEAGTHLEDTESQSVEDESKKTGVSIFTVYASLIKLYFKCLTVLHCINYIVSRIARKRKKVSLRLMVTMRMKN